MNRYDDDAADPSVISFFGGAMSDRAERLTQDRDRLEAAMDEAPASALAALVREHRMVLAELESLAAPKAGSTRDQLAARREARTANAAGATATEV